MRISPRIRGIAALLLGRAHLKIERNNLEQREVIPIEAMSQREAVTRLAFLCKKLGFEPKAIVDAGASDGRWTRAALEHFPAAQYFLIEPLGAHDEALNVLCAENANIKRFRGILGEERKALIFNKAGHVSSIYGNVEGSSFGDTEELEASRLDDVLREAGFPAPDLIKMDIEGSELAALKGAPQTLGTAEMVQVEVSFLPFKKDYVLFDEIVSFMSSIGFRVFDIYGVYGRPLDRLPAQGECIFIRKDTKLISDLRWGEGLEWS